MLVFSQFHSECAIVPDIKPTYDMITCVHCYQFKIYSDGEKSLIAITCESVWQKACALLNRDPDLTLWPLIGIRKSIKINVVPFRLSIEHFVYWMHKSYNELLRKQRP